MDEGHDADDDANEAGQQREDHEGSRGVQVGCGQGHMSTGRSHRGSAAQVNRGERRCDWNSNEPLRSPSTLTPNGSTAPEGAARAGTSPPCFFCQS